VIPIVTPEEMAAVDAAAADPEATLIERAGYAVAVAARRMLNGAYGARITVVAGRGNNGADGRAAARHLSAWGASVSVVEASTLGPGELVPGRRPLDLVIDAAYGTGLSRPYAPPEAGESAVLAVDIPSGLHGGTGEGEAMSANRTVTFAALKPGLLTGHGPDLCGDIVVADIGLGAQVYDTARAWLVTDEDVEALLPKRPRSAHKWQSAVEVVGGSATMNGAPLMAARGAFRAGAGYVLLAIPGSAPGAVPAGEHVRLDVPAEGWDVTAAEAARRVRAIVVGPGLGAAAGTGADSPVRRLLANTEVPAVVDADALGALGDLDSLRTSLGTRREAVVLTPHEGEYRRITGHTPSADRITDVRDAARETGAVVLLKGSPTVVAAPDGRALIVTSGSPRLATAGTGDVLSGIIAAFLARGLPPLEAAALAAHTHGRAASEGFADGLVASDLPEAVAGWLSRSDA
jgi:NAD(P)H-hydrate epimerase